MMNKIDTAGMNAAAVGALARDDMENFLVASSPGGIERQEAAGQKALVESLTLPKDARPRAAFEAMGIAFLGEADDLFAYVELPEGWEKRATGHAMHSDLLDELGRLRASIFYKAAFYDRSAHMRPVAYYRIETEPEGGYTDNYLADKEKSQIGRVVGANDVVAFEVKVDPGHHSPERAACVEWLEENRPDFQDTSAYWD